MGDIADEHVSQYESGRRGMPMAKERPAYPTTTKEAIAQSLHHVAIVLGGVAGPLPPGVNTNRIPDTLLLVTESSSESFWVNASKSVTGISKVCCRVLTDGMPLEEARARREALEREVKSARKVMRNALAAGVRPPAFPAAT